MSYTFVNVSPVKDSFGNEAHESLRGLFDPETTVSREKGLEKELTVVFDT